MKFLMCWFVLLSLPSIVSAAETSDQKLDALFKQYASQDRVDSELNKQLAQFGLKVLTYKDCEDQLEILRGSIEYERVRREEKKKALKDGLWLTTLSPPPLPSYEVIDSPTQTGKMPYLRIVQGEGIAWILRKAQQGTLFQWMNDVGLSMLTFDFTRLSQAEKDELKVKDWDLFKERQAVLIPQKGGGALFMGNIIDEKGNPNVSELLTDETALLFLLDQTFMDIDWRSIIYWMGLLSQDWDSVLVSENGPATRPSERRIFAFLRILSKNPFFPYAYEKPWEAVKTLAEQWKSSAITKKVNAALTKLMQLRILIVHPGITGVEGDWKDKEVPSTVRKEDALQIFGQFGGIPIAPKVNINSLYLTGQIEGMSLPWAMVKAIRYLERSGYTFNGTEWVKP